jgi:hypothetical protein
VRQAVAGRKEGIPTVLNGWPYKYSSLLLFYHQPKIEKTEGRGI